MQAGIGGNYLAINKKKKFSNSICKKYICEIIIVCSVILIHGILNANLYPLTQMTGYDEQATLFWMGLLSKSSWKQVIEFHNYYGFGFTAPFGILHNLISNPVIIYQIIMFVISLIYSISAVIAFRIIQMIVPKKNKEEKIFSILISIASVFVPIKFTYIINEHLYILINWLLVYILIKMLEDHKHKILYRLCIILLLGYSLTVHEKAITLWLGVIATIIVFKYYYLEKKRNVILMGGGLACIYKITKKLNRYLRNFFWGNIAGSSTNSSSSTISLMISKIKCLKKVKNWVFPIVTFFSQLFFISFCTGGIFLSVLMMSIYILFKWWLRKEGEELWQQQVIIIIFYTLVCIFATIVIQDITWMPDLTNYKFTDVLQEVFGKRAKLYLRYFCCYCGPLIVLFGVYCMNLYKRFVKISKVSVAIYGIFCIFEVILISPWYSDNRLNAAPIYSMFLPFTWENPNGFLTREVFIKAIFISCLIVAFFYILLKFKKFILLGVFIAAFFVYQYLYTGFAVYKKNSETIYAENYPVYEALKNIKNVEIIYVPQMKKEHIRLKFYLTDYSLTYSIPNYSEEEIIVIYDYDGVLNSEFVDYNYSYIHAGAYEIYLSPDIEYIE